MNSFNGYALYLLLSQHIGEDLQSYMVRHHLCTLDFLHLGIYYQSVAEIGIVQPLSICHRDAVESRW